MKRNRRKILKPSTPFFRLAALGSTGLGLVCGVNADSLITFGGFFGNNNSINSTPGYGDNISATTLDYTVAPGSGGIVGTPDISLDWIGQWDTYTGWDGRGEVAQSDFNGGRTVSIVFVPSASAGVHLMRFELDEWAGGGDGSITWTVEGSSGPLATGLWTMNDAGGRTRILPSVTGQLGESLTLSLQLNTGAPSYFALDNLAFAQVPEPSTLGLGALGVLSTLGAAAMRRRKARPN